MSHSLKVYIFEDSVKPLDGPEEFLFVVPLKYLFCIHINPDKYVCKNK